MSDALHALASAFATRDGRMYGAPEIEDNRQLITEFTAPGIPCLKETRDALLEAQTGVTSDYGILPKVFNRAYDLFDQARKVRTMSAVQRVNLSGTWDVTGDPQTLTSFAMAITSPNTDFGSLRDRFPSLRLRFEQASTFEMGWQEYKTVMTGIGASMKPDAFNPRDYSKPHSHYAYLNTMLQFARSATTGTGASAVPTVFAFQVLDEDE